MIDSSNEYTKEGKFNKWNKSKTIKNYQERNKEIGKSDYVTYQELDNINFNLSINKSIEKVADLTKEINIDELNKDIIKIINELYINYKKEDL